eukprot:scpid11835/ scgid3889/ Sushi, von Willebrand factor type A, EGF and pentraxin domain-containing protein 1
MLEYTCEPGHVMSGSARRECSTSGTFTGTQPTCAPVQCPDLFSPLNGAVFQPSRVLNSNAYYSCETGHTLAGTYVRRCMSSGAWNGSDPVCTLNTCPQPISPEKGSYAVASAGSLDLADAYKSVVDFKCDDGYWLRGSPQRTCMACGSWSGSQPVCEPVACDSPETPKNGDRASANLTFESLVTYSCNSGFSLNGGSSRVCGANGKWTTPAPSCEPVACPQLASPANGYMNGEGLEFLAEVEFGCDNGYVLLGSERRLCQANSEWSGTQAVCRLIDCGDPGQVDQATRSGTVFTYNEEVSYSCGPGYMLSGGAVRRCQENGDWSGSPPSCVVITCGDPGTPSNGIRNGDVFTYNAEVSYSCVPGYSLDGTRSRTCLATGMWSRSLPTCNAIACADPGTPANGGRTLSSLLVNSQVTYTCNTGYRMAGGSPSRTCQVNSEGNAVWTGTAPVCQIVDCGAPATPDNAVLNGRSYTYLSSIGYACSNKGYVLEGDVTRTCQSTGMWTGEDPTCVQIDCGPPGSPANGDAAYGSSTFESVVNWMCNPGYVMAGSNVATCQFNGQWSAVTPTCIVVSCGDPGTPANGNLIGFDFDYSDSVGYTCSPGYQMVGSALRVCQADGTWSGQTPLCVALYCENPGMPGNGDWDIRSVISGASVNYTCDAGFRLQGTDSRSCEISQDGLSASWTGSLPSCSGIFCPQLSQPENGVMRLIPSNAFESEAKFMCNPGYTITGSTARLCTEDGTWTGTQPTCQVVDCGSLESPQFGSVSLASTVYGSTARYQCNTGYNLVGLNARDCQANGFWLGAAPTCVPISCGDPGAPMNGGVSGTSFNVGATIRYECERGFVLVGASSVTCQSDGSWSSSVPLCEALACPDPGIPVNGDRDISRNNIGSLVTYTCNTGYSITGAVRRECVLSADATSANWDSAMPQCQIVDCGTLSPPNNGQMSGTETMYRSQVRFTCSDGYILTGSMVRTCQANGLWSGQQSSCQPVDCGAPEEPANSNVAFQSSSYQSIATISCLPGYVLSGTGERRCQQNGLWSGASPVCNLVTCGDPGQPINGVRIGSTFTYGSQVLFECVPGYNLVGLQELTCELSGRWSGSPPTCRLLDCADPGSPINGDRYLDRTTLGARVNFTCNPGYSLRGSDNRECLANDDGTSATWNQNIPNCVEITCLDPGRPENGDRVDGNTGLRFGSEVNYICDTGYALVGESHARCMANGQWSNPLPSCQIVDCGARDDPAFSTSVVSSTQYAGSAVYTCNTGYMMLGARMSTCQANGQWSTLPPVCMLITCGNPGVPANGVRNGEVFSFGATVSFTCNSGYRLVGSQQSDCTSAGLWSNPAPRCVLLSCPDPERPLNGDRDFTLTSIGAIVDYTCNTGYSLRGSEQRTCQPNAGGLTASWSSTLPTCEVVDCGNPGPLSGGVVTGSSFTYNSQVSFRCNTGYNLAGSELRTCLARGTWSGVATTCVLIDCGDPG